MSSFFNENQRGFAASPATEQVGNRLTYEQLSIEDQAAIRLFKEGRAIPAQYTSDLANNLRERQRRTLDVEQVAADREDASITDVRRLVTSGVEGGRRILASSAGQEAADINKLAPLELAQALQQGSVDMTAFEEALERGNKRYQPEFTVIGPGGYRPPATETNALFNIKETLDVGGEARDYSLDDMLKARRLLEDDTGAAIEERLDDIQEALDKDMMQFQIALGNMPTMQKDLEVFLEEVKDLEDLNSENAQALLDGSNIAELAAQSSALSLGIMGLSGLTGVTVGALTRSPVAGRAAAGGTAFAMTNQVEFQMEMLDQLIEKGVDPFNARAVYQFRQDNQEEFNSMVESAKVRANTIATGEGLTMGAAGRTAQAGAQALRAAKFLRIGKFMQNKGKAATLARGALGVGAEAAVQGGIAAGAEATQAVLRNMDPDVSEVVLEGLLEAVMGTTMETTVGFATDRAAQARDNFLERRQRQATQTALEEGRINLTNQLGSLEEVQANMAQRSADRAARFEQAEENADISLNLGVTTDGTLQPQQYDVPVDNVVTSLESVGLRPDRKAITEEEIAEAMNTDEETGNVSESAEIARVMAHRAQTGNIQGESHNYPDYKLAQLGWNKDAFNYEGNFPEPMTQLDITDKDGQDVDNAAWFLATDRSGGIYDGKVFLRRGRGRYLENVEVFDNKADAAAWLQDKADYWSALKTKEEQFNELFQIPQWRELNDWIVERATPEIMNVKEARDQKIVLEAVNPMTGYVRFRGTSRGKEYQGVLNYLRSDLPIQFRDVEGGGTKSAMNKKVRDAIARSVSNVMGLGRITDASTSTPLVPAMPKSFKKNVKDALEAKALLAGLSPQEAAAEAEREFNQRQREYNYLITDTTGATVGRQRAALDKINEEIARLRAEVFVTSNDAARLQAQGLRPIIAGLVPNQEGQYDATDEILLEALENPDLRALVENAEGASYEQVQEWLRNADESARRPRGIQQVASPEQKARLIELNEERARLQQELNLRAEDSPNREVRQQKIKFDIPVPGPDQLGGPNIRNVMPAADIKELNAVLEGKIKRPIFDDDGNLVRNKYEITVGVGDDAAAIKKYRPSYTVLQGTGDLQVREITVYLDADPKSATYGEWLAEINKSNGYYHDAPIQLGPVEGLEFASEAIKNDVLQNVAKNYPELANRKGLLAARARAVQELRKAREEARESGRYEAGTWGVERGRATFAPGARLSGDSATQAGGNAVTTPRGTFKGKQGPRQTWLSGRGDRAFEDDMAQGFANEGPVGASDRFAGQETTSLLAEDRTFVESGTRDSTFTSGLNQQMEAKREAALKREYAKRVYRHNVKVRNEPEAFARETRSLERKANALRRKRDNAIVQRDEAIVNQAGREVIEPLRLRIDETIDQIRDIDRDLEARAEAEGLTARAAKIRRDGAELAYKQAAGKVKKTRAERAAENKRLREQRTVDDIDQQINKVEEKINDIARQMEDETERGPLEELDRKLNIEEETLDRLIGEREKLTGSTLALQRTGRQMAQTRRDRQLGEQQGNMALPVRQTPEKRAAIAAEEAAEQTAEQAAEQEAQAVRLRTLNIRPSAEERAQMGETLGVEPTRADFEQPGMQEFANIQRNRRMTEFGAWNTYVETTDFIRDILNELNDNSTDPMSEEDAGALARAEIVAQERLANTITDEAYGYSLVDAAAEWANQEGSTFAREMQKLTGASAAERREVIAKLKERNNPKFRNAMRGFAEAMLNKDEVKAAEQFNAMASLIDAQIEPQPTVEELEQKVTEHKKREAAKPKLKKLDVEVPAAVESVRSIPRDIPLKGWVRATGVKPSDDVSRWARALAINTYMERFGISEVNADDQFQIEEQTGEASRIEEQLARLTARDVVAGPSELTEENILYDDPFINNLLRLNERQLMAIKAGEPLPESLLLPGVDAERTREGLQEGRSNFIRKYMKSNRDIPRELADYVAEFNLIAPRVQQRAKQAEQTWKVIKADLARTGIELNRDTAKGINMILENSSRAAAEQVIGAELSNATYNNLLKIRSQIARLSANISRNNHAPLHVTAKIDSRGEGYLHASTQLRGIRGSAVHRFATLAKGDEGWSELERTVGRGRLLDLEQAAMEVFGLPQSREALEQMSDRTLMTRLRDNGQAAIQQVRTEDGQVGPGFTDPASKNTYLLRGDMAPDDANRPPKEVLVNYILENYKQLGMENMRSRVVEALQAMSEEYESQGSREPTIRSEYKARDVLLSEREKTEQFIGAFLNVDINNIDESNPGNIAGREARRIYPDVEKRRAEQEKFVEYLRANADRLLGMEHKKVLQEMKARFPFVREAVDTQDKLDNYNELLRGAMMEVIDPGMRIVDTVSRLASIHESSLVIENFFNAAVDKGWVVKKEAAPEGWTELARPGSTLAAVNINRTSTRGEPNVIDDLSEYYADPTVAFAFRSLMNDTKLRSNEGLGKSWRGINALTKYNLVVGNLKAHPRNAASSLMILASNSNMFLPGVNIMGMPDRRIFDGWRQAAKIGTLQLAQAGPEALSNWATEKLDADKYSRNIVRVGMRQGVLGDGARTQALMDVVRSMEADGMAVSFGELQENPGLLSDYLDRKIKRNEIESVIDRSNPVWEKFANTMDEVSLSGQRFGKGVLRTLEEAFRLEDEAVKIAGFMNQVRFFHYMKGGDPASVETFFNGQLNDEGEYQGTDLDQIELGRLQESIDMAGRHVRDVFPTFSMTPEAVRLLNRDLLIGAFPSFQAEMIRNGWKQGVYLWNLGMKGQLPDGTVLSGQKRALAAITAATGSMNYIGGRLALQMILPMSLKAGRMLLSGGEVDDDKSAAAELWSDYTDWRPRALMPDFYEHSSLQLGDVDPETGDYSVYDLSFSNPNGGVFSMVAEMAQLQKELNDKYGTLEDMDSTEWGLIENEYIDRAWAVIRPALVTAGVRDEVTMSRFFQEFSNYVKNRPLQDAEGNPVDSLLNAVRRVGRAGEIDGLAGAQAALAAAAPVAALAIPGVETLRQAVDIGQLAGNGDFDELAAMAGGARLIKRNVFEDGRRDMMFRTQAMTSYGAAVKTAIMEAATTGDVEGAAKAAVLAELNRKEEFRKINQFMQAAMVTFDLTSDQIKGIVGGSRQGDFSVADLPESMGGFTLDDMLYGDYRPVSRAELLEWARGDEFGGMNPEQKAAMLGAIERYSEGNFQ